MNFGEVTTQMKNGKKAARVGWNGKRMFVFYIASNTWGFNDCVSGVDEMDMDAFICMKTAGNTVIP